MTQQFQPMKFKLLILYRIQAVKLKLSMIRDGMPPIPPSRRIKYKIINWHLCVKVSAILTLWQTNQHRWISSSLKIYRHRLSLHSVAFKLIMHYLALF
jgi:hypothetical protein